MAPEIDPIDLERTRDSLERTFLVYAKRLQIARKPGYKEFLEVSYFVLPNFVSRNFDFSIFEDKSEDNGSFLVFSSCFPSQVMVPISKYSLALDEYKTIQDYHRQNPFCNGGSLYFLLNNLVFQDGFKNFREIALSKAFLSRVDYSGRLDGKGESLIYPRDFPMFRTILEEMVEELYVRGF